MCIRDSCIHICHDCNFRCRYCFADEGAYHSAREFMSEETAKAAVDFLIANSGKRRVLEMDFFGGEPLMNLSVLKKTVYYAKEQAAKVGKKFLFTTTTNALLLNDETIKFFNEMCIRDSLKGFSDEERRVFKGYLQRIYANLE